MVMSAVDDVSSETVRLAQALLLVMSAVDDVSSETVRLAEAE